MSGLTALSNGSLTVEEVGHLVLVQAAVVDSHEGALLAVGADGLQLEESVKEPLESLRTRTTRTHPHTPAPARTSTPASVSENSAYSGL